MVAYRKRLLIGSVLACIGVLALIGGGRNLVTADPTAVAAFVPVLPAQPFNYANQPLPAHYNSPPLPPGIDNTPGNNPITDDGATLGRVLFYDTLLSQNQTVSCASCHVQANAFSDSRVLSVGFEGGLTGRHSMSLSNARYYNNGRFFWDERAATLEDQVLMPIQDGVEMGLTLTQLVDRVSGQSYYPPLFEAAFGTTQVTSERISRALAQFVRSMVTYRSRYDVGRAQDFANFTAQELRGQAIFIEPAQGNCAACHGTDAFAAPGARNSGLDLDTTADQGLGTVTGNPADNGKFKSPSLRNIALTAPYMHDGRFATLLDVINFYNNDVQAHPNLDPALRIPNGPNAGQPRRLGLDAMERADLIAFLNTLTDQAFVEDVMFSNPFQEIAQGFELWTADTTLAGSAGTTIVYTISLTNTGGLLDSYDIALVGNTWAAEASSSTIQLAAEATADFTVSVTIPANAIAPATDMVAIAINGTESLTLTTAVTPIAPTGHRIFLPLVQR